MKQVLIFTFIATASSFLAPTSSSRQRHGVGPLYLEDWVADMIDDELHRQANLKEYEKEWTEKNRAAIFHRIETDFVNTQEPDAKEFQMYQRDTKLARRDPERYCADRCITTGNCDVFEDFFELSPEEVISFCTECVLAESDDASCDIPEGFYDKLMP